MNLGIARDIRFETPLMWFNKAKVWTLADYYHQIECIRYHTLICYNNIKSDGCGERAAYHLRFNGLDQYQTKNKLPIA